MAQQRGAEEQQRGGGLGRSNSRGSGLNGGVEVRCCLLFDFNLRCSLQPGRTGFRHGAGQMHIVLGCEMHCKCESLAAVRCVPCFTPAPDCPHCPSSRVLPQRAGRSRSRPVLLDATGPLAAAPIEFFAGAPPPEPLPAMPSFPDAAALGAGCAQGQRGSGA